MLNFSKRHLLLISFIFILSVVALNIKSLTIFFAESYLSKLLDNRVKVSALSFYPLQAEAFIGFKENRFKIHLLQSDPIEFGATYEGDIDAFKRYHPLKGHTQIDATLLYDNFLLIDANTSLYDSKTAVRVQNLKGTWGIHADISELNIQALELANKYDFNLSGKLDAKFDLLYKDKNLTATLSTPSFGGELNALYKNDKLFYAATSVHLTKIFKTFNQEPLARGYLNLNGELSFKESQGEFAFNSPKITLLSPRIEEPLEFRGDFNYKERFTLNILSNALQSKSEFHLDGKTLHLKGEKLELSRILKLAKQENYATAKINLKASGDFEKLFFSIKTDDFTSNKTLLGIEQKAEISVDGSFITKSALLDANYTLTTPLKREKLKLNGSLHYDKEFSLSAESSDFDAKSSFSFHNNHLVLQSTNLNINKLLQALDEPSYADGNVDLNLNGNLQDIDITIKSKNLKINRAHSIWDENIALDLFVNYKPKLLTIKPYVKSPKFELLTGVSHYSFETQRFDISHTIGLAEEDKKIDLLFKADISTNAPYHSQALLAHKRDRVIIDSFSYEDPEIKSSFYVDIAEINKYKTLTSKEFFGRLKIEGKYDDALVVKSSSLGKELKLEIKEKNLHFTFDGLELTKIATFVGEKDIFSHGKINGGANYNLVTKSGSTDINIRDVVIDGIDLDKKLSAFHNTMGVNIFGLTEDFLNGMKNTKAQTTLKHVEFDITLEDEKIKLQDVALSTQKFLIVAQGELAQDGEIKKLNISLVEPNGCSIITQELKGELQNPEIASTTSTLFELVGAVPSSVISGVDSTLNKVLDFATNTVDKTLGFFLKKSGLSDANVSITTDVMSTGKNIFYNTSEIILPTGCRVIYSGRVKHPQSR